LDEIKRVRLEEIRKLLIETDLPLMQIAVQLRFSSVENIYRYFRQATGMGPVQYRKKYGKRNSI